MEFFRQKSIEILKAAGATKVWANPVNDSRGGAHNRGTCRMGNDPKTSVVDKFHRAHDVPNLFIVDGSNLVTGGRNHPTMTIQALAYPGGRASDQGGESGQSDHTGVEQKQESQEIRRILLKEEFLIS